MADKDLQKLKRSDLFELLLEQSKTIDNLKLQLQEKDGMLSSLNKKLEERNIDVKEAGTIAEAAFKLNGVYEAAEKAAQQYLENLKELQNRKRTTMSEKEAEIENRCMALIKETQERCILMKESTVKECEDLMKRCQAIEADVESRCRYIEEETKKRCAELYAKTKELVNQRLTELTQKQEELLKDM